ncbi:MAG: tetratricopeptide repeat protein, partial [Saprospiraceae bacterium]|nr:tetratricopeptide repeat protein [Saprospiraceae bacterium]
MKRAKSGWLPGWILITLFAFPLPARCQEMSRDTLIWHANDYFNKSFNQARRNSDLAQIYADSSKMLYEAADEPYGVMRYDYLMGVIERFRGNFPKAKEHLNEFLVAAIDKKDTLKMADTHFQLGTILQNQGLLDEAIEHGYASIRLYEAAGYPQYTADSYTNLGIIYRKLKQYDSAEQQYRRALEIDEELNDLDGQAGNNANLGNLFAEQSRYEEAIQCYRRAMRFDSLNQSLWGLAYDHEDIGNMYNHQGHFREGLNQHFRALGIRRKLPHKREIAFSYQNIGNTYFELLQYDRAIIYLDSAAAIGRDIQALELLSETALVKSKIYAQSGNYRLAYAFNQEYTSLHDTLINQGVTDKINTLNAQFETEIKENQIALLNSENELKSSQLTAKKRQLAGLMIALALFAFLTALVYRLYSRTESQKKLISKNLDEKEILLREIHHRVKNNLQFISSLLNLQTEHIDDEKALSALQEGQDRVQSMALIHQN